MDRQKDQWTVIRASIAEAGVHSGGQAGRLCHMMHVETSRYNSKQQGTFKGGQGRPEGSAT